MGTSRGEVAANYAEVDSEKDGRKNGGGELIAMADSGKLHHSSNDERFKFNCDRLRGFLVLHKRLPLRSVKDVGEHSLNGFIRNAHRLQTIARFTNEKRQAMNAINPGLMAPKLHYATKGGCKNDGTGKD